MRAVLRHRDVRRYLLGQLLSIVGDTSLWLGVGIYVKDLTGSSSQAGLVFFFFGLPYVAGPAFAFVVDRVRRRRLMIVTNLASAGLVCLLLLVRDAGDVWLVYLVMALYGLSGALLSPAQSALLTVLLPSERLGEANGILQTGREVMRLVTPLIGAGVVAATGGVAPLVIGDAVTFVVAAGAISSMRLREPRPEPSAERLRTAMAAGIRHVWATLPLRQIIAATGVAIFFVGMNESIIFSIAQGLDRSPAFVGVLVAVQGAGSVIGGPISPYVLRRLGDGWTAALGLALVGIADAVLASQHTAVVFVGVAIGGIGVPLVIVAFATAVQQRTPAHLQGRAYSAADAVLSAPQTLAVAIGAALITVVDYRLLLLAGAVVVVGAAGYLATRREHRAHWTRALDAA